MTDTELLEAAARTAGIEYEPRYVEPAGVKPRGLMQPSGIANIPPKWWNPLTDDGDALRLAVKLKMDVKQWQSNSIAVAIWDKHATEDATQDRYAATRRAIVRAAAAMASGHNAVAQREP